MNTYTDKGFRPAFFKDGVMCFPTGPVPKITNEQFTALEKYISRSADADDFSKKMLIWLLRKTESFTKGVKLELALENSQIGARVTKDIHKLNDPKGTTHITLFLEGMGIDEQYCRIYTGRSYRGYMFCIYLGEEGAPYREYTFEESAITSVELF